MKIKVYIFILLISGSINFLFAESHSVKENLGKEFEQAVKNVESKNFTVAVKEFTSLANQNLPEAQFNLSLLYFNGLGTPKNFKTALYWSWQAHLNGHETAKVQVEKTYDSITEDLRNVVASEVIDELLAASKAGDQLSALKLGQTFSDLLVVPDYKAAYVWLSIAQAYGLDGASELLSVASKQLTVEDILLQQDQAAIIFSEITK